MRAATFGHLHQTRFKVVVWTVTWYSVSWFPGHIGRNWTFLVDVHRLCGRWNGPGTLSWTSTGLTSRELLEQGGACMALVLLDEFERNWTFLVDLDRIGRHGMTLDDPGRAMWPSTIIPLHKKVKTHSHRHVS